jgi:hypothetical protein
MTHRGADEEQGAVLVTVAAGMVAFLMIAALVIDLGALRLDRRADNLAADLAVTAAVAALDPFSGSDAAAACQRAWDYALANLADEGAATSVPDCVPFGATCNPGAPRTAVGTAGPYTITIVHPVPDGHLFMGGQAINVAIDGSPCQRLGVRITRTRDYAFASVAGFDTGRTNVISVARLGVGVGEGELVPLLVLEPIACDALFTSGQGKVTVSYFNDTPGIIVVDSNASKATNPNRCGSNSYSIDSKGTQLGWIRAIPVPGKNIASVILSYALSGTPGANAAAAFDPSDLTDPIDPSDVSDPLEPVESFFRLYPEPFPVGRRITRAPIDWRYNCQPGYPDYPLDLGDPSLGGIPITGCPDAATTPSYIDQLRAQFGDPADIGTLPGGGFARWTDTYGCNLQPSDPPIAAAGNWWIDCPGGISIRNSVTFTGGSVVSDGDVRVFGSLSVNQPAASDQIFHIRSGDFIKDAQAFVTLDRTLVYLGNGVISFGGGSGGLIWISPIGAGTNTLATRFEDLALWSEAPRQHELGGQAGNVLEGTLFTPNADPFSLTGQAGQFQTAAQFLTRRLEVKGQGEVRMHPDPDRISLIPVRDIRLVR